MFGLSGMLQLRLLQEAIKREEDSLAEEHRREIQARAEADEAAKVAYYEAKQRLREQRLEQVGLCATHWWLPVLFLHCSGPYC
jgi:hypothetical protein